MLADMKNEVQKLKNKLKQQDLKYKKLKDNFTSLRKYQVEAGKNFKELYDFNPTIIITIDQNYTITQLNYRAAIFFGSERNTLINTSFLKFIHSSSKILFEEKMNNLLNSRLNQTANINLKNVNRDSIQATMTCRINADNLIHLYLFNLSREPKKSRHYEIEHSFALINKIFEGTNEALAAVDSEFNLKIINESFSYLFSKIITNKIAVGMNLIHRLSEFPNLQSKILEACKKALEGERSLEVIENSFAKVNDYYCFELNIYPYLNNNVVLIRIKNLTNYKIEERLKHQWQAEIGLSCRSSAKEEMASALAHEINQPLSTIVTYSQACLYLINENSTKDILPRLIEPLKKISIQAELAGEIIHNMRNLGHKDNFYREKTNINEVIKDTLSLLQYELLDFKLDISLNLQEGLPLIMANKIHLMQVLLNLARNSIEAFHDSNVISPELSIATNLCANVIEVHIRDNGPGIPSKYLNKVLNTYFTTKSKGTGIGLGICKTLIENHGGKLHIHSDMPCGAWFSFTLPVTES